MLVGVAFRAIQLDLGPQFLGVFLVVLGTSIIIGMVIRILRKSKERKEGLRNLREFTDHSPRISSWLREHKEELQRRPIETLNNQEFVDRINKDQELYERVLEVYPDYPDTIISPKELHQYFIELVQGQHKQTH